MAARAKELNIPALALTDHGTLNGIVRFVDACKKHGVRPILGVEAYWTPDMENKGADTPTNHLVMWAATNEGYRNLIRIVSAGHIKGLQTTGFRQTPRIDDSILEKYGKGIIASSSCLAGRIPRLLLADKMDEAIEVAKYYSTIFDKFVLELQPQEIPEQYILNARIVELAEKTGLPLIVTNDSHYACLADADDQDVFLAIQTRKELSDPDRFRMSGGKTYWIQDPETICNTLMWDQGNGPELVPRHITEQALRGTVEVAELCNAELELGKNKFPHFPMEDENKTEEELLRELAHAGLFERLLEKGITDVEKYQQRLNYELDVVISKGYAGYFLIVSDIVKEGKRRKIPFNPGRGSGGGSLLAWALRITEIDPIRFDLLFERFLNPARESPPDIDIDVAASRRQELIDYVAQRYGRDRVAQIGNVNSMGAKDALKRTAKAYGLTNSEIERISKRITAERLEDERDPEVLKFLEENPEIRESALKMQGRAISRSIHAGGIVIAPDAIMNYTALQLGKDGEIVTQADMSDIERLGLLKIDLLGVRTADVLDHAIKLADDETVTWDVLNDIDGRLDLDWDKIYELLRAGNTESIFQIESNLMKKLIEEVKPTSFEDLVAIISLGRPGPMQMIPTYARRKHGLEPVTYLHPKLKPILEKTYGIFVYQEQIIQAVQELAGYSAGEADIFRRAIGKKEKEVLDAQYEKFAQGCREHSGMDDATIKAIWDVIEPFSGYSFNRSHAVAYGIVGVWTAYVRIKSAAAFWTAVLSNEVSVSTKDRDEKILIYADQARRAGVKFKCPDVNKSDYSFTLEGRSIRWGLSGIKGLGPKAAEQIMELRPFESLNDFLERVDKQVINKSKLRALVFSGALDDLPDTKGMKRNDIWNTILQWRKAKKMPVKQDEWVEEYNTIDQAKDERRLIGITISYESPWDQASEGSEVQIKGAITEVRKHIDRNKNEMAFVTFESEVGDPIRAVCFAPQYRRLKRHLQRDINVVLIGRKQRDSLIIEDISKEGSTQVNVNLANDIPLLDEASLFSPVA